jgi:hypothetical protein
MFAMIGRRGQIAVIDPGSRLVVVQTTVRKKVIP